MKTIGERSLAAGLRVFLEVLRLLIWVVLVVLVVFAGVGLFAYSTGFEGAVLGIAIENVDPAHQVAFEFVVHFAAVVVALVVIGRLRRIFATLSNGDPFVPENAEHLRMIALVIAAFEVARLAAGAAFAIAAASAGAAADGGLQINLIVWIAVLALFVLAEVFKEGSRLRHDQQMTI